MIFNTYDQKKIKGRISLPYTTHLRHKNIILTLFQIAYLRKIVQIWELQAFALRTFFLGIFEEYRIQTLYKRLLEVIGDY